jgi:orotidine-5'-phosphate decarboxylase
MHQIGELQLPETFSRKLEAAFATFGQLCVGIDPHPELLEQEGFDFSVAGLRTFSFSLLEELSDSVGIIKPQVSFFEQFGSSGFKVLEDLCVEASSRGLLVIADAKRGDIGTTMSAYANAWLGKAAPFVVDALTVSPYLGVGSLIPAISAASERGKGVFILCATSNPEAKPQQLALTNGSTIAANIAKEVFELNRATAQSKNRFGSSGLVIGATVNLNEYGLQDLKAGLTEQKTVVLAPGFGAQGARLSDATLIFGENSANVIYSISRSALRNGLTSVKQTLSQDKLELSYALIA